MASLKPAVFVSESRILLTDGRGEQTVALDVALLIVSIEEAAQLLRV